MDATSLLRKFVDKCPFAVLTQMAIRGVLRDDLDEVFHARRSRQYEQDLLFSDMAFAVADVVLRFAGSFNQAYDNQREKLGVSRGSFYEKINATEPAISEGVVEKSVRRAAALQDALEDAPWEVLPGYRVLSIDGNHLQETEKRLQVLRDADDAPLAGIVVARFDHQRGLFDRAYLIEDAHAQECSLKERIAADLGPGDVLLGDRHYCVLDFLRDLHARGAAFVIRQHGRFRGVLLGRRRKIGTTSRGAVYEQTIRTREDGDALVMRRITVALNTPTEDGATEVHLLSNLPAEIDADEIDADEIDAATISDLYLLRWEEERAFYYLRMTLTCELKSVSGPKAALFLFCMALLAFNVRQVLFAALFAEHEQEAVEEVSHHRISVEVSRYTDGMLAAVDESTWKKLVPSDVAGLARRMREVAAGIDLSRYKKSRRGPKKKKPPKPTPTRRKTHMSTAKALAAARSQRP
jgi:hypothetical protein